ncbi:MAG: S41 family peptidase [Bacteroidota bacterium]
MRALLRVLFAGLIVISLTYTPAGAQNLPNLKALQTQGKINQEAQGVWQNLAYGWTIVFGADEIDLYHYSSAGCLPDEVSKEDLIELAKFYARTGDTLYISGSAAGSTLYQFEQIDAVPAACNQPAADSPTAVFDYFYKIMDTHYAFFDVYDVDWNARYQANLPKISDTMSEEALFEVLRDMLKGLNDGHLVLRAEVDGERKTYTASKSRVLSPTLDAVFANQTEFEEKGDFSTDWFFGSLRRFRSHVMNARGQGKAASGNINWGKIGNIGYINVFGMGGFDDDDEGTLAEEVEAVHAAMDLAIAALQDTDGIIFDVSLNQGGYDEVSLALASHFTNTDVFAYTKVGKDSPLEPQRLHVKPAPNMRYLKPVTLLTSDLTVSAAEIFTMAMRALPNVTHRGDTTWGALSDILSKQLPNGWLLELSNEIYIDSKGQAWEGKGIPPTERYTIFDQENIYQSHHNAVLQIAQKMREGR